MLRSILKDLRELRVMLQLRKWEAECPEDWKRVFNLEAIDNRIEELEDEIQRELQEGYYPDDEEDQETE